MNSETDTDTQAVRALARKRRALNKIHYWMNDGEIYGDSKQDGGIRIPGLPVANYIEDRRLKCILFELGKKRQQFIEHAEYEKQQFIDERRRKIKSRKALTAPSGVSREVSKDNLNFPRQETDLGLADKTGVIPANPGTKLMADRLGLLYHKQNEETPNKDYKTRTLDTEVTPIAKTVQFKTNTASMHIPGQPKFERLPTIPNKQEQSAYIPWDKMKSTAMESKNMMPPLLQDPRFSGLEKNLSPLYQSKKSAKDIRDVISDCESLHQPPKTQRLSKAQKTRLIRDFLFEQGIVF